MIVKGNSGIGKSILVKEIYKPITEKRGYFISGKFDQLQRNIPYSAVVSAFNNLVKQILGEDKTQLNRWRENLLKALGGNVQVIIDLIPEVELIIGKQPELLELGATETQNRFNLVLKNFIRVFCSSEHPLVIFLDDLQWADSASLKLIELIILDEDIEYLFLIGSYRDNEINPTHPLITTLNKLQREGTIVNEIILKPLTLNQVNKLIADTLKSEEDYVQPLAELVWQKTQGNPFFVNEFLKSIYSEKLLVFNPYHVTETDFQKSRGCWQWDLKKIERIGSSENLVKFLMNQIQKLPKSTQEILSLAACIGTEFNLKIIAIISEKSQHEIFKNLIPLIDNNVIIALSELDEELLIQDYRFGHDRIQQGAYGLMDHKQKLFVHLKIGYLLWENTQSDELAENIFKIVDHLNLGYQLITNQQEREKIARLNVLAAQKAEATNAYEAALKYLKAGTKLLGEESWQTNYDLILAIHSEAAKVAYLSGDFAQMDHFVSVVLQQAKTLLDKVKVYEVKSEAYHTQGKELEAIQVVLPILKELGCTFHELPQILDIQAELARTQSTLAGKQIEDLIELPEMTEPEKLAVMKIINSIFSSLFTTAPKLLPLMICKQVNLSVQYGNSSLSAFAYVNYGIILCGLVEDFEKGYQFGQLAFKIIDKFQAKGLITKTIAAFSSISIWKEPIQKSLATLQSGYQTGIEIGDLYYATINAFIYSFHSIFVGQELNELASEIAVYDVAFSKLKQENTLNYLRIYSQTVLNLMGEAANPCYLIGQSYNEEIKLPLHQVSNDRYAICALYVNKLYLCYLFGEYAQAVDNADKAEQYLDGATATLLIALFNFYDSLAHLALYNSVSSSQQEQILARVSARLSRCCGEKIV